MIFIDIHIEFRENGSTDMYNINVYSHIRGLTDGQPNTAVFGAL